MLVHALLAAGPALLVPQPSPGPLGLPPIALAVRGQDDRESLQRFLERLRARRDARLKELVSEVTGIVTRMRALAADDDARGLKSLRDELVAMGPVAAPLLVNVIDPGREATDADRLVAQQVSRAMRHMPTPAVTERLLTLAQNGSRAGRINAMWVLAGTPEPQRVSPVLHEIYAQYEGSVREAALVAIATIGGPANKGVIVQALGDADEGVVGTALRALSEAGNAEAAPQVLELMRDTARVRQQVGGLLAYFEAVPGAVGGEAVDALITMAADREVAERDRLSILAALPDFEGEITNDHKRRLKDLTRSGRRKVAEGAMVAMAILGDGRIKRELLKPYDDDVSRNDEWASPYSNRAEVYYRIRDYKNAIKDYRQALKFARNDPRADTGDLFVGLARSYAAQDKLRDAHKWLQDAPISRARLQALAGETVFAKLLESDRYRDVFRLED